MGFHKAVFWAVGPLLYSIYVNDFSLYIKEHNAKTIMYADDTVVMLAAHLDENITASINSVFKNTSIYCNKNKLKLNVAKTHLIQFHTSRLVESARLHLIQLEDANNRLISRMLSSI